MPLSPLPAYNTKRYFVGLEDPNAQHHIQIRVADSIDNASALTALQYTFGLVQPVTFSDYTFNELLVAENGSDIRNPVAGWTPIAGSSTFAQADREFPLMITARGRATSGRKVKFALWGQFFTIPTNWLYDPVSPGDHATFLALVNSSPTYFLAIDGTKPVWRADFTVDYNDHWVQKARP